MRTDVWLAFTEFTPTSCHPRLPVPTLPLADSLPLPILTPIITSRPPRRYWACPEVATPNTEQHISALMYEWMRTHRIAMEHWDGNEDPINSPRTAQHHEREWEQYSSIAAYCQHRVFLLGGWPLPNPGLGFPTTLGDADLIFSPKQNWRTPQFWDVHLRPNQGRNPPPEDGPAPLRHRLFHR